MDEWVNERGSYMVGEVCDGKRIREICMQEGYREKQRGRSQKHHQGLLEGIKGKAYLPWA